MLPELRVERSQHRVRRHHDLIGRKREHRATRHRIVRYEYRHLRRMREQGVGNLLGSQYQTARRMQYEIYRDVGIRQLYCVQQLLGILDTDVSDQRKAEQTQGLLAMNQRDHAASPAALQLTNQTGALSLKNTLAYPGLQARDDYEDPEE